ncbi:oleosin S1-2-like [Andrographis paniculata]|uniref:oleosin S1-2-like n=1 Tax=Andrographis paniculata TaxID=175694 RepID=UPI0021E7F52E|nr:oleosin S1-2-like [Andrographis paniculata]
MHTHIRIHTHYTYICIPTIDNDKHEMEIQPIDDRRQSHVSGSSVAQAAVAGLVIGGPLLGLMGISFAATASLMVVASPVLILFSPLLFAAAFVFALAMLGFAAAGAMAITGLLAVGWVFRPAAGYRRSEWLHSGGGGGGGGPYKLMEGGGAAEERRSGENITIDSE